MRVHRRLGDKPTIGLGSVVKVAIVIAGVAAVALLVVAHPLTGLILVVSVALLAVVFERVTAATKDEPPPE